MVLSRIWNSWSSKDGGEPLAEKSSKLPFRPNKQGVAPTIELYPFQSENGGYGVIVKIQPPEKPDDDKLHHVPCDLVLCIDVSGSMACAAPMPAQADGGGQVDSGLSVLDLVKHTARAILETLDHGDRLGIVTFSTDAKVLQPLAFMTARNKATTLEKIQSMQPRHNTNLWHGIREGLKMFRGFRSSQTGRVPALFVLTDGLPNHMCPQYGYVPMLRAMGPLPATIHTFGFGYRLRSGLLKSIAGLGGGNYSFIPDPGMMGTAFIHATANLQSTFANNANLCLTFPGYLELEETTGEAVENPPRNHKQNPVEVQGEALEAQTSLNINLSDLQYGQSRDVYLRTGASSKVVLANSETRPPVITATLSYQHFTSTVHRVTARRSAIDVSSPSLPRAEIAYHISRSALVSFLSTLTPLNSHSEHVPLKDLPESIPALLQTLHASLPASNSEFAAHPGCHSLLLDLCGTPSNNSNNPPDNDATSSVSSLTTTTPSTPADPSTWTGQIALALLQPSSYHHWGVHYLPSLAGAHARQVCLSGKDAGPLQYGSASPLFVACRDRLHDIFNALPAPERRFGLPAQGSGCVRPVVMGMYNNHENGCFAEGSPVRLGDGRREVGVEGLREGVEVGTPKGPRRVVGVVRMEVVGAEMCVVGRGGMVVTPWHPVKLGEGGGWVFPGDVAVGRVRYTGAVYSVLLERDEDVDAHAILVSGVWGVTMGHRMTDKGRDVRGHHFYGDYDKVSRALARLPRWADGVVSGEGLMRDAETGLVNGFSRVGGGTAGTV